MKTKHEAKQESELKRRKHEQRTLGDEVETKACEKHCDLLHTLATQAVGSLSRASRVLAETTGVLQRAKDSIDTECELLLHVQASLEEVEHEAIGELEH